MSTNDERAARMAEIRGRHEAVVQTWSSGSGPTQSGDIAWLLAELEAATARAERAESDRAERLIDGILSDLCDMEQDDPDHDDAIVVLYEPLKNVLTTWIRYGGVVPPFAALAEGA